MRRVIPLLLALAGCGAGGVIDLFSVVQETNTPPPPCDGHQYGGEVTRACDAKVARVDICSPEPLCQAQVDALLELVRTCALALGAQELDDAPGQCAP